MTLKLSVEIDVKLVKKYNLNSILGLFQNYQKPHSESPFPVDNKTCSNVEFS